MSVNTLRFIAENPSCLPVYFGNVLSGMITELGLGLEAAQGTNQRPAEFRTSSRWVLHKCTTGLLLAELAFSRVGIRLIKQKVNTCVIYMVCHSVLFS